MSYPPINDIFSSWLKLALHFGIFQFEGNKIDSHFALTWCVGIKHMRWFRSFPDASFVSILDELLDVTNIFRRVDSLDSRWSVVEINSSIKNWLRLKFGEDSVHNNRDLRIHQWAKLKWPQIGFMDIFVGNRHGCCPSIRKVILGEMEVVFGWL